jgi:hypothetical protein
VTVRRSQYLTRWRVYPRQRAFFVVVTGVVMGERNNPAFSKASDFSLVASSAEKAGFRPTGTRGSSRKV